MASSSHVMVHGTVTSFFQRSLKDIELDMPVLNTAFIYVQIFNGSYSHHGIRSEY
jgi:hypothetical protein